MDRTVGEWQLISCQDWAVTWEEALTVHQEATMKRTGRAARQKQNRGTGKICLSAKRLQEPDSTETWERKNIW